TAESIEDGMMLVEVARVGPLPSPYPKARARIQTMQQLIRITDLLYPHWQTLTLALVAVLGTSITDVIEPWPRKIVFDCVFRAKQMQEWLAYRVGFIGTDKFSILNFAVLSVITIAVFGAISSYWENYLSFTVGQCVMHDLPRVLYSH